MSLFKFGSLGMYTNAKNNPRVKAVSTMKNGYVFGITDGYSSGGSKSKVVITVASDAIADGNIVFDIGGQTVYTVITALTQDDTTKVATQIKASLDAVLLGLGYTVSSALAVITITAPANGASLNSVTLSNVDMGDSAVTLTPVYTAGTDVVTSIPEAATPFATDAAAKAASIWVQMNIIDTPELDNQADYVVSAGEYVNAFELNNFIGYTAELSSDLVIDAYATVAVGDYIVPAVTGDATPMKWKKTADTGYGIALKILEKTTFGGTGYFCKIVSN